jgi:hypothetical protein
MSLLRDDFPVQVRRSIAPLAEIERCLIKTHFSVACNSIGQAVPYTVAPDDLTGAVIAARSMGYPVIVKPKSHLVIGTAKRGALVRNELELRRAYRRYPVAPGQRLIADRYPNLQWPLLQVYVPSARRRVYSVSGVKDPTGGILASILTIKREQWPPDVGVSIVQAVCNDERILSAGLKSVDELLSCGIFELELLIDGDNLLAIDLNPRAFGFMMLDMAAGNDLPWLWWQTTRGEVKPLGSSACGPLECRFVVPYCFAHGVRALFGPRATVESGDRAPSGTPWISMVGNRGDPLPMLLAQLRLLRLLLHPNGLVRPYLAKAWYSRSAAKSDDSRHATL